MRQRILGAWVWSTVASSLVACVHERSKAPIGTFPEGVLARPAEADSSWSARAFGGPRDLPVLCQTPYVQAASPEELRVPCQTPSVQASAPSVKTSAAPPAHRPIPAGESLAERARSKFLTATTEVNATRATLYVPRELAGEVALNGENVAEEGAGRRTASGRAVVRLRRLTLSASRVTVVVRDAGSDVQLSARGDVSMRSDQPASVIEESGLRSLLLLNDGYTPLP